MKRLIPILIIIAFWFSAIGYFHVYKIMQAEIRHNIKVKLEQDVPEHELTVITFSSSDEIDWVREGKEFRLDGKMYDVVRRQHENGLLVFFCIDDRQETALISQIEKLLKDSMQNDKKTSSNSLRTLLQLIPNLFYQDGFQNQEFLVGSCLLQDLFHEDLLEGFLLLHTPPPVLG